MVCPGGHGWEPPTPAPFQAPGILLALTDESVDQSVFIECLRCAQLGEDPGMGEVKAPRAQGTELRPPTLITLTGHHVFTGSAFASMLGAAPCHHPDPRTLHGTLYSATFVACKCDLVSLLSEPTQGPLGLKIKSKPLYVTLHSYLYSHCSFCLDTFTVSSTWLPLAYLPLSEDASSGKSSLTSPLPGW